MRMPAETKGWLRRRASLARRKTFKVEAIGAVEAAIARAPSDLPGEPRLIGPEKVKVTTRGKDACERQVHDVLGAGFPAKRIVVESAAEACVRSLWGRVDQAVGDVLQTVTLDDLRRQAGGSEALDFTI